MSRSGSIGPGRPPEASVILEAVLPGQFDILLYHHDGAPESPCSDAVVSLRKAWAAQRASRSSRSCRSGRPRPDPRRSGRGGAGARRCRVRRRFALPSKARCREGLGSQEADRGCTGLGGGAPEVVTPRGSWSAGALREFCTAYQHDRLREVPSFARWWSHMTDALEGLGYSHGRDTVDRRARGLRRGAGACTTVMGLEVTWSWGTRRRCSAPADRVRGRAEHPGVARPPGAARGAAGGERRRGGGRDPDRAGVNCESPQWCPSPGRTTSTRTCRRTSDSQYDEPISFDGYLDVEVEGRTYRIVIERAHMEEDTGKSTHVGGATGGSTARTLAGGLQPGRDPADRDRHQADRGPATCPDRGPRLRLRAARPHQGTGSLEARMDARQMRCDVNLSLKRRAWRSSAPARRRRTSTRCARWSGRRYEIQRHAAVLSSGGRSCRRPGTSTRTTAAPPRAGSRGGGGLPLLPGARPGAGRPVREWVEQLARHAAPVPAVRRRQLTASGASRSSTCSPW